MAYQPTTAVEVRAWGRTVGAVSAARDGYGFEYDPDWKRSRVELSPLLMPTASTTRVHSFRLPENTYHGLPPMIADALPDKFGHSIVNAWFATQGINREQITPLDRLACLGGRGMGALEFVPDRGPSLARTSSLDISDLIVAARAVVAGTIDGDSNSADALGQIFSVGASAGGARAKAVVNIDDETQEIRSGQSMPESGEHAWLLKFDGVGLDRQLGESQQYTKVEFAYSRMAVAAGITMFETRLLAENGRTHFLAKRFDRDGSGRIHMQSLCGLAAIDFNAVATHDYAQLFTSARSLDVNEEAILEIFKRMVFNVAASNHDDHSKNHSFLLREGGRWELSPAYDITYAKDSNSIWLNRHLMGVNGKFDGIQRSDLLAVADRFGVPSAKDAISDVMGALDSWAEFANDAGVDTTAYDTIGADFVQLR